MGGPRRVIVDCRLVPEAKCTLTIAGSEEEVYDAAKYHALNRHGFKDTPDLRGLIRSWFKEEALQR